MATRNKRVPIPLPIRGLNTVEPFNIGIDSGYARELTNYYIKDGRLVMRPAIRDYANSAITGTPYWIDPSNASIAAGTYAIAGVAPGSVIICTTGAVDSALTGTVGGTLTNPTLCKHSSLEMLLGLRDPRRKTYPFAAYTAADGVTPATLAMNAVKIACSHRGRLYYGAGTVIDYSTVGQVLGAMPAANTFNLASVLDGQSLSRIFSVTAQNGIASDSVFVAFGDGGKVLVYSGDNPGAANWSLVGAFNMPAPVNSLCFLEIDGDIFVATAEYCYWFRELFSNGAQSAYQNSPTKQVENFWRQVGWPNGAVGNYPHVFYIKEYDLILIRSGGIQGLLSSSIGNYGGSNFIFVYHRSLGALSLWITTSIAPGVQQNSTSLVYYAPTFNGATRLDFTSSQDYSFYWSTINAPPLPDLNIETSWKTPYFAAFEGVGNKVNSVRVWFENTISGYFEKVRAIFDYSDYNSPVFGWYTQSMVTQVNPANYGDGKEDGANQASNQYHPIIGASGAGGGVSFQFTQKAKSGSSTTQNQSIYAATAYIEEAGELW